MSRWAVATSDQGPVYLGYRLGHIKNDGRILRAVVYNKGAMVLHMLRRLVGDDVFFRDCGASTMSTGSGRPVPTSEGGVRGGVAHAADAFLRRVDLRLGAAGRRGHITGRRLRSLTGRRRARRAARTRVRLSRDGFIAARRRHAAGRGRTCDRSRRRAVHAICWIAARGCSEPRPSGAAGGGGS